MAVTDVQTEPGEIEQECPECGAAMELRRNAYGEFWGCARYPSCTALIPVGGQRFGRRRQLERSARAAHRLTPEMAAEIRAGRAGAVSSPALPPPVSPPVVNASPALVAALRALVAALGG